MWQLLGRWSGDHLLSLSSRVLALGVRVHRCHLELEGTRNGDGVYLVSAEEEFTERALVAHVVSGREGWKIRLGDYATTPTTGSQNWSGQDAAAATTATTIVTADGHPSLHCCCLRWLGSQSCCSYLPEPLMTNSESSVWRILILCLPPSCKGGWESG